MIFNVFLKWKPTWLSSLISQKCWLSTRRSLGTWSMRKSDHSNHKIREKTLFSGTFPGVLIWWVRFLKVSGSSHKKSFTHGHYTQMSLSPLFHCAHHLVSVFHRVSYTRISKWSISAGWQLDNVYILPKRTCDTLSQSEKHFGQWHHQISFLDHRKAVPSCWCHVAWSR